MIFSKEKNMLEAAAVGAFIAIKITAEIVVMVLVFVSMLALLNGILNWFGSLIDLPQLSFEVTRIMKLWRPKSLCTEL